MILHVVWDADREVLLPDQTPIPTLELKSRVAPALLERYKALVRQKPGIPCAPFFPHVPELTRLSMLDRVLHERLLLKSAEVEALFEQSNDWEETAYQVVAQSFGMKINSEPLLQLARVLPLSVLRRHLDSLLQLEALLLGQAGFLEDAPRRQLHPAAAAGVPAPGA